MEVIKVMKPYLLGIPWSCGLLLQIDLKCCSNGKAINYAYVTWHEIHMDPDAAKIIQKSKGSTDTGNKLHYPDPSKQYIVYIDASDNACGAHLSQEHDWQGLPVTFLSHTITETQWK